MTESELKLRQAQLRMELRDLEVQMQQLRHEQRFYQRLGFERELRDAQMLELQQRKRLRERRLHQLQQRARCHGGTRVGWLSWLILSPLLLLMGLQSLVARRLWPTLWAR